MCRNRVGINPDLQKQHTLDPDLQRKVVGQAERVVLGL